MNGQNNDVIRVEKPDWMPAATWVEVKAKITDKLNELVADAQSGVCPTVTPWCERHEYDPKDPGDEGYCWSRSILVGEETLLDVSNGNADRRPVLHGLSDLDTDGLDMDVAIEVAAAITALCEEVGR